MPGARRVPSDEFRAGGISAYHVNVHVEMHLQFTLPGHKVWEDLLELFNETKVSSVPVTGDPSSLIVYLIITGWARLIHACEAAARCDEHTWQAHCQFLATFLGAVLAAVSPLADRPLWSGSTGCLHCCISEVLCCAGWSPF